jgi:hypothetical protein
MRWGRTLKTSLAVVLVVGACSSEPAPPHSLDRPTATSEPGASGPTSGSRSISLSSISGRIAFDNHDDVWPSTLTAPT